MAGVFSCPSMDNLFLSSVLSIPAYTRDVVHDTIYFIELLRLRSQQRSWELVPREKGILSDTGYKRRSISFDVEVEAASTHRGKPTVTGTFSITFEVGVGNI